MLGKIVESLLLGVGLAMDAFSVSLVNGMSMPDMKRKKACETALVFGLFQTLMPLLGWVFVHWVLEAFSATRQAIPWIGFLVLAGIGGHMLWEGFRRDQTHTTQEIHLGSLLLQGLATSIDALSVGFAMADSGLGDAVMESCVIGLVTFAICMAGVRIGRRIGVRLADKASILGGIILIAVGLRILLSRS